MNKSKIILGSAQFRMNYGIIGSKVKSLNDINKIINFAKENNFYGIETAQDYADTEKFLGKTNLGNLKLISKFNIKKNNYKNLKDILNNSFKNLNVDKIFGFLFHNEKEIFTKKGQLFYNQLLKLKADGIIKNIGVSVYNLSLSKKILKNFKIDILQIPFSIFDQRFLDKEFIYLITKKNIKIHARSIFLQGMLINNKKYHYTFNNKIKDYHNWIKLNALNPVSE
jgi:Predicted oxidoreductases (related to aryl-alcohol dehydrogenases)